MNKETQNLLLKQLNDELEFFKLKRAFSNITTGVIDDLDGILDKYKQLDIITYKIEQNSEGLIIYIKPTPIISEIDIKFQII